MRVPCSALLAPAVCLFLHVPARAQSGPAQGPCFVVRGAGVTATLDVPYGPAGCADPHRQCLNVFLPDVIAPCAPTVVWLHGGGWSLRNTSLDKDSGFALALGETLAASGIPVVCCDYYLSSFESCGGVEGTADPLQAVRDAKAVLAWIRDPMNPFQLPQRIVAAGTSAGAHLAALLATTQGDTETYFDPPDCVDPHCRYTLAMAILFSPPLDFVRMGCVGIPQSPECAAQCGSSLDCSTCTPLIRRGTIPPGYPCADDPGSCFDSTFQEAFLGETWHASSLHVTAGAITYAYDCDWHPGEPAMPTHNPWFDFSPHYWVSGDEPPTYVYQARCDAWVSAAEGDEFAARMGSLGVPCVVTTAEPRGVPDCTDHECLHAAEQLGTPNAAQTIATVIRERIESDLY